MSTLLGLTMGLVKGILASMENKGGKKEEKMSFSLVW